MYQPKPTPKGALWKNLPSYKKSAGIAAKTTPKAPARGRIRSMSSTRAIREKEYAKVKADWWGTGRACIACALRNLKPVAIATDVHHYRGKAGLLKSDSRFFLPVCRPCHTWIDANRNEARSIGLLCKSGYNSMRQPDAYKKALETYFAGKSKGLLAKGEQEPDPKAYDLGEWEAGQIKKAVVAPK